MFTGFSSSFATSSIATVGTQLGWFWWVLLAMFGAVFGSFAGVVGERIPAGEPISGRSHCDACGAPIPMYWNIPIVGWLILRGKARCCGARIPAGLLWVEVVTAAGFILVGWLTKGDALATAAGAGYVLLAVVMSIIDWHTMTVPWKPLLWIGVPALTLAGVWAVLAVGWGRLTIGLGMAVGVAVGFEVIALAYYLVRHREGLGGGDTHLAVFSVGIPTLLSGSWIVGLYGVVFGFVLGAVYGGWLLSRGGEGDTEFPFGPFLLFGPLIVWAIGRVIGIA